MIIRFKKKFVKFCNNVKINFNKSKYRILLSVGLLSVLLIVFLGCRMVPAMFANQVYGISNISENLDNVKSGDIVNYEINGYSKWRVLSVDKENGTIDVTSDTNVYDLTIEPNKTIDEYNAIFQAEASKFNDNKYVVNSRTISKSDALTFDTKGEFWLSNVNEKTLMTNLTGYQDTEALIHTDELAQPTMNVYLRPTIINKVDTSGCNVGSKYTISSRSWTCKSSYRSRYYVNNSYYEYRYSSTYLSDSWDQITINSSSYFSDVLSDYISNLNLSSYTLGFYSFYDMRNVYNSDFVSMYNDLNVSGSGNPVYVFLPNYYNSSDPFCKEKKYKYECTKYDITELKSDGSYSSIQVGGNRAKVLTFGYRPVLTLNIKDSKVGKSTSDSLSIGDNVKYDANGYRNWKVLSINKKEGTVDIISGGIVKNISLYGSDDYDNYEQILKNEVDSYKNGSNVIDARAITSKDVDLLIDMNDTVTSMYWYNVKNVFKREFKASQYSSVTYDNSYDVGLLWTNTGDYYINDINDSNSSPNLRRYWVRLFSVGGSSTSDSFSYYSGNGNMSYVAGLRPIITLKYDFIKVLSDVQARKLDKETKNYDRYYSAEQSINNNKNDSIKSLLYSNDGDSNNTSGDIKFNSSSDCKKIKVDLGSTYDVLSFANILAILYGLIVVCLSIVVILYSRNVIKNSSK